MERPVREGTSASRPWIATRMVMNIAMSATASMASAPRRKVKNRLNDRPLAAIVSRREMSGPLDADALLRGSHALGRNAGLLFCRFLQAVSQRLSESVHRRKGTNNDFDAATIQHAQTQVEQTSEDFGVVPRPPAEDGGGIACIPAIGEHDAKLRRRVSGDLGCELCLAGGKHQLCARSIVPVRHAWGSGGQFGGLRFAAGAEKLHRLADDLRDHLRRDGSGTVDGAGAEIEDGGLKAHGGRTAIEYGVDAAVEVGEHVRGGGRAGVAKAIG